METLKSIIASFKILGISIAGITFIVLMIKIAIEPEMKAKYIKLTKHLLIATVLITVSVSIAELPKHYYGSKIEIVDSKESETTIAELKDKDCQGRETVNINGKWYVVTDSNKKIGALTENDSFTGYRVYTVGEKFTYENITREVKENEQLIAIRGEKNNELIK